MGDGSVVWGAWRRRSLARMDEVEAMILPPSQRWEGGTEPGKRNAMTQWDRRRKGGRRWWGRVGTVECNDTVG